ncbi:MAG TPA: hypothetical protein VG868_08860, partial [Casimicrobiaceae bacterium]|nr:hypothetical protein [Casimicrobiaceae bacterium]
MPLDEPLPVAFGAQERSPQPENEIARKHPKGDAVGLCKPKARTTMTRGHGAKLAARDTAVQSPVAKPMSCATPLSRLGSTTFDPTTRRSFMRFTAVVASALTFAALACTDAPTPTTPVTANKPLASISTDRSAADARTLRMYDSCDPATFNAVFNDPTICIKQGHVPFDRFIAELTQTQHAAQWR